MSKETVTPDPTYKDYVARCKNHGVTPLTEVKWQTILVEGEFRLEDLKLDIKPSTWVS